MHIDNLNSLTQIFLVTYSILYGIMLNSCMGINLFPYGQLCKNPKAIKRLIHSLLLINIIPIIVFAFFFLQLEKINKQPSFFSIIGVFLISMIVFSPYRFLQALIVSQPTCLYQRREIRSLFKGKSSFEYQTVKGHMVGVIVYIIFAVIGIALICYF